MHIDAHRSSSKHSKRIRIYCLAHHFVSYLFRQTPRMHWDLRWSDVETLLLCFSTLKHLWGQKLLPVGVLKSSAFLCRNVALPKVVAIFCYMLWCHSADTVTSLRPSSDIWTAKGSTSTYHRQYAVQSDTSTEIGWPNELEFGNYHLQQNNKTHYPTFHPNLHQVSHKDLVVLACLTGKHSKRCMKPSQVGMQRG